MPGAVFSHLIDPTTGNVPQKTRVLTVRCRHDGRARMKKNTAWCISVPTRVPSRSKNTLAGCDPRHLSVPSPSSGVSRLHVLCIDLDRSMHIRFYGCIEIDSTRRRYSIATLDLDRHAGTHREDRSHDSRQRPLEVCSYSLSSQTQPTGSRANGWSSCISFLTYP